MARSEKLDSATESFTSFVDVLRWRAELDSERRAFTFLSDGSSPAAEVTYGELDRRVRQVAAYLQQHNARGKHVLLMYPPGLDYVIGFLACLYAGAVAVPCYPPDVRRLQRTLPRLQHISADAEASLALTTSPILGMSSFIFAQAPDLAAVEWLATDSIEESFADAWQYPETATDSLAFLQYTSGSTRDPRGVMVSHGNLLHNSRLIQKAFQATSGSIGVIWLPPYHDMGLIGGILQPLYTGIDCILMSPIDFLQRPVRWLQAISTYGGTISGGPNFAYDLCVRKVTSEELVELDLSSWRLAFTGAEPVRAQTMERFTKTFTPCGFNARAFYPCYGLAEATLIVSGGPLEGEPRAVRVPQAALERGRIRQAIDPGDTDHVLVGCGPGVEETVIKIVDPETQQALPERQVGEIWVSGPSVARGYWKRSRETANTFGANLVDDGNLYLRTGDLGYLDKGELFVTGRIKDLIIIRGRNIYPQDIEWTVEQNVVEVRPGCGAAFAVDVDGREQLVLVQEIRDATHVDVAGLTQRIRQVIAEEHALQAYAVVLLPPHAISKTSSGKIQRQPTRQQFLDGTLEILSADIAADGHDLNSEEPLSLDALLALDDQERLPWLVSRLREHFATALGVKADAVDASKPLDAFALESLAAVELVESLGTALGVSIPVEYLLQNETLEQLGSRLLDLALASQPAIAARHDEQRFPLSAGQKALWFLQQVQPDSPAYNRTSVLRVVGPVDAAALERALQALTDRHPMLRTTIEMRDGDPVQITREQQRLAFGYLDASRWSTDERRAHIREQIYLPFDLEQGPLLRAQLLHYAPDEHVLIVTIHHIVADLWSLALYMMEFGKLYNAEVTGEPAQLRKLRGSYQEYVQQETELLADAAGDDLWNYWRDKLSGEIPYLELPSDHPRPAALSYRGALESVRLSSELSQQLKALAKEASCTPYTLLLAAFQVLLHRYTGQEDITVGSPWVGRTRRTADEIGYFVNPMVMRAQVSGELAFTDFLYQVRETVREGIAHAAFPFPLLVERLEPQRVPNRSPLFQVMFSWQQTTRRADKQGLSAIALNIPGQRIELGEITFESMAIEEWVSPFDLTMLMAELGDTIGATVEYSTDLFEPATIRRLLAHLETLLAGIVADPQSRIDELPLLTDAERQQLLADWVKMTSPVTRPFVHERIDQQAVRRPQAIAVECDGRRLSYAELRERSNKLADHLRDLGVQPGQIVAVMGERSEDSIVALLGILKAGATYLPIDPDMPSERVRFIMRDATPAALLVSGPGAQALRWIDDSTGEHAGLRLVDLAADWPVIARTAAEQSPVLLSEDSGAYVIYTSGSTGQPKGVVITHAAITDHCHAVEEYYELTTEDRVYQFAAFSFDQSLEQILPTLAAGARLVLRGPDIIPPESFPGWVAAEGITVLNLPPAYWEQVTEAWTRAPVAADALRLLIIGGDVVKPETVSLWQAQEPGRHARLLNAYGPTETTITATTFEVPGAKQLLGYQRVPIGRPLPNRALFILDRYGNPVPVGVPGELYIGGTSVAKGYLNRLDLTRERFVPTTALQRRLTPFDHPIAGEAPMILYRTGDLCRYLPDGNVDFLGRVDNQVKLRGFRIELGEIEATLVQHPAAAQVAVVVDETGGDKRLVACVARAQDAATDAEALRQFLRERLPAYMIPAAFVLLPELPLMPSGKFDRQALQKMAAGAADRTAEAVPPRTPVEKQLVDIWSELLGTQQIGIRDDFFNIGGHSLLATRMASSLRDAFGVEIPLRTLFEATTIEQLASCVVQQQAAQIEAAEVEALLAELEGLSLEDSRAMLAQEDNE